MLIEWLWEIKEGIDKHGIRVGLILTLFVMYRKELRNMRLDLRDEAMFHNQHVIMESLGLIDQWHGLVKISHRDLLNLKKWQQLFWEDISRVEYLFRRRKNKMNQQINWFTLIPAVFGTLKLVLQPFGIDLSHITDDQINNIVNGVAALLAIYGVFATHRIKVNTVQSPALPKPQLADPDKFIQG
jgi:uncharacterized membrane protein